MNQVIISTTLLRREMERPKEKKIQMNLNWHSWIIWKTLFAYFGISYSK